MSSVALSPGAVGRRAINPWFVAVAVIVPTFMEVLDTTIANVALRYIAGGLSTAVTDSEWVITSYLAANAIILPISGWLAAQLGRCDDVTTGRIVSALTQPIVAPLAPMSWDTREAQMGDAADAEYVEFVSSRLPKLRRAAYLLCGDWTRGDDIVSRTLTDVYVHWAKAQRADNSE